MARTASTRARVHRDLRFDGNDHQKGEDVKALQAAINARAKTRGIRPFLLLDGDCGRQTIAKGRQVASALGCKLTKPGLSRGVQWVIRTPVLRTPAMIKRAKTYVAPVPHVQPSVKGNRVRGGTKNERLFAAYMQAAHLFYTGVSHRFYSQGGVYTANHGITGERYGERSDCSQFVASMHYSCGLVDPSGEDFKAGYTGTLASNGTYIGRGDLEPGCLILYGPAPHHHVEGYIGDGKHKYSQAPPSLRDRTVGHGSPPVDLGTIDMIAEPHFVRPKGL